MELQQKGKHMKTIAAALIIAVAVPMAMASDAITNERVTWFRIDTLSTAEAVAAENADCIVYQDRDFGVTNHPIAALSLVDGMERPTEGNSLIDGVLDTLGSVWSELVAIIPDLNFRLTIYQKETSVRTAS